jgi:hypothetical protein
MGVANVVLGHVRAVETAARAGVRRIVPQVQMIPEPLTVAGGSVYLRWSFLVPAGYLAYTCGVPQRPFRPVSGLLMPAGMRNGAAGAAHCCLTACWRVPRVQAALAVVCALMAGPLAASALRVAGASW